MKILNTTLLLGAAAAVLAVAPVATPALAQTDTAGANVHRDWTLGQREDWLHHRVDESRDNGALTHTERDRAMDALHGIRDRENDLRDHQNGQLTPAQTETLEARLDRVADNIHWANSTALTLPW
ncbi:MAG TPA: hypothetical protein VGF71_10450 [Caulobacteraceae bacterium]